MTSGSDAEQRIRELAMTMAQHPSDIFLDLLRTAWREATEAERLRAEYIVRKYLQFDSQRAVSWHEIQDCRDAIRKGEKP